MRGARGASVAAAAMAGALLAACGGGVIQDAAAPPPLPPGLVALEVRCDPPDAEVTLDDAFAGQLDRYRDARLAVTPGAHRLRLGRRGCLPAYHDLEVPPEGGLLRARLVCPEASASPPPASSPSPWVP